MTTKTSEPLWTWEALVAASGGTADGDAPAAVTGVSIDTRTLEDGNLFVALRDARDGHEFVGTAFGNGAAAALVRKDYQRKPADRALIRADDPLAALGRIGVAARARLAGDARVIAVTGSAGKTGTKEMLRACLSPHGKTHGAMSQRGYSPQTRSFWVTTDHVCDLVPARRLFSRDSCPVFNPHRNWPTCS